MNIPNPYQGLRERQLARNMARDRRKKEGDTVATDGFDYRGVTKAAVQAERVMCRALYLILRDVIDPIQDLEVYKHMSPEQAFYIYCRYFGTDETKTAIAQEIGKSEVVVLHITNGKNFASHISHPIKETDIARHLLG